MTPAVGITGGEPNVDVNVLSAFLQNVQSYAPDLIYIHGGPGQSLFHYTDLAGLQGIVQGHDLWLTHSRYSNDDEEMLHGQRTAERVLEECSAAAAGNPDRIAYLDRLAALIKTPSPEGVYICCFCLTDNVLSQWRGIRRTAMAMGRAIQIDPNMFSYVTGPDSPHGGLMRLWKVFYDANVQTNIIQNLIEIGYSSLKYISKDPAELARHAAAAIRFFIPTLKNPDFREESECRLIFTQRNCAVKPQFRVARQMLVPYYRLKDLAGGAFPNGRLPITGVRIGPSANKLMNAESARMLLEQSGYTNIPVACSETPFRG